MLRPICGGLAGALVGGFVGFLLGPATPETPKDRYLPIAKGLAAGFGLAFPPSLIFFRGAQRLTQAVQYAKGMRRLLPPALKGSGWHLHSIRADGEVVLIKLTHEANGRQVMLQRVFPHDAPLVVLFRNRKTPLDLLSKIYRAEAPLLNKLGRRNVWLDLSLYEGEEVRRLAMSNLIEALRLPRTMPPVTSEGFAPFLLST